MKFTIRVYTLISAVALAALVPVSGAGAKGVSVNDDSHQAAPATQAAPASVSVKGLNAAVQLNWSAADGATSYNVYQGTSSGVEANTPVQTGISDTTVTISGLNNDTQYFFKISASSAAGESSKSVEVRAVPYLPIADAPAFSVASGTYTNAQHVSVTDDVAGASIYYTTDGSLPTSASKQYDGALTIDATTVLRAIAVASGHSSSGVTAAVYTINLAQTTATSSSSGGGAMGWDVLLGLGIMAMVARRRFTRRPLPL